MSNDGGETGYAIVLQYGRVNTAAELQRINTYIYYIFLTSLRFGRTESEIRYRK